MKKTFVMMLGLSLIFAACTSSRITTSWKADNIEPKAYNKVLVLGLINEPDRTIREQMEHHVVEKLRTLGYKAVCSCDEFNPKSFESMTEKQALDMLSKSGIDAVLTIVLLDKVKERYYVPGRVEYTPYIIYQRRFYGYYSTMYGRVYTPGYYSVDTKYFWESNFYELGNKNLLYSAQSQSFNSENTHLLANEYAQMIVDDMVNKTVLRKQPVLK